jgi:hypothetical protein
MRLAIAPIRRLRFFDHEPQKGLHERRRLCKILLKIPAHFAAQKRDRLLGVLDDPERKIAVPGGTQLFGTKGTRIFWTSARTAL